MQQPPADLRPQHTADGSFTLRSELLNEQYHSLHGAAQESTHVFIHAGLRRVDHGGIDLLEVGLGSGLNALLTWVDAEQRGMAVRYSALEPHPLPSELLHALDHPRRIGHPERSDGFERMMCAVPGERVRLSDMFTFESSTMPVQELDGTNAFDLVYFDAFAPEVQPEMWTEGIFARIHRALRPEGVLVTYCAKGAVRRAMMAAGLQVERLPGPPGKREMLRARKPWVG